MICAIYKEINDLKPIIELLDSWRKIDEQRESIKKWKELAFHGGHLEPYESIEDSVIREVKEETRLTIKNTQLGGVKQAFLDGGGR